MSKADVHIVAVAPKHGVGLDRIMDDRVTPGPPFVPASRPAAQRVLVVVDTAGSPASSVLRALVSAGAAGRSLQGVLDDGTASRLQCGQGCWLASHQTACCWGYDIAAPPPYSGTGLRAGAGGAQPLPPQSGQVC